ncbi:hypothetical protein [Streptomyces genisteinicus]|uniref:Uncharacterized protein n=1 Tax=Streptomyces genisteinicus TaxID=2768068 RepID=A0A7H0HY14_9ACTN|nr:hypothetical protein [Streptomyces genisteinicus]QNP65430.1 hypothetical protein IAG43_22535 [Streptomyces genisteinicus]
MIILVAALLVMGIMLGAVVQLPASASLVAGTVIGCWLIVFAVRERRARRG